MVVLLLAWFVWGIFRDIIVRVEGLGLTGRCTKVLSVVFKQKIESKGC